MSKIELSYNLYLIFTNDNYKNQMNKKLFIIIGKPNSHKSSVMRCLTGCRDKKNNWKLSMIGGDEIFYIKTSSPQEQSRLGITPQQMVDFLLLLKESNIMLALQSNSVSLQPNGNIYLREFIKAGFDIQDIVSFDEHAELENLKYHFFDTNTETSNATASKVRKIWNII